MSLINSVLSIAKDNWALVGDAAGDKAAFEKAMRQAEDRSREILKKNRLSTKSTRDNEYTFKKGHQPAHKVARSLDVAKTSLPGPFKKQVGLGLMALGRTGSSMNSMQAGAELMNCASSGQALKDIFGSLGAERSFLTLDKKALPALGQILAGSGQDQETIDQFLSGLANGQMSVEELYLSLSKLDFARQTSGGGLIANEDGLPALGQFFAGLGASSEIVDRLTSGFATGQPITAAELRSIFGSGDDGFLTPCLTESDVRDLMSLLKSMGAGEKNLNGLAGLLSESKGQLTINEFLNFVETMEAPSAKSVSGQEMEMIKTIMDNISRQEELAKTPVFNEILTKIQMLGDREIDDDFAKFSPALQALRGGISSLAQNAAFGGGGQREHGAPKDDSEAREHYRHLLNNAVNGRENNQASAVQAVESFQGYGGQESLARQVSQKMVYSHRRGVNRLKMRLNPEHLGRLDIELRVKDDQLVAHIRAENREAYRALSSEIESLKEALAESGLEIANLTVAFDDAESGDLEFADLGEFKNARSPQDEEAARTRPADDGAVHRVV